MDNEFSVGTIIYVFTVTSVQFNLCFNLLNKSINLFQRKKKLLSRVHRTDNYSKQCSKINTHTQKKKILRIFGLVSAKKCNFGASQAVRI